MTTNCIDQIGEHVFVTNLFWTCNCETDSLCIDGLGECPHCGTKEEVGAPADISLVLKHADQLPKNRVQELIEAMTSGDESMYLEDILTSLAVDNGFHETDDTGALYLLSVADAINTLMRMIDEGEIFLQELTGDNYRDLLQHIADNITFDWDEEIRWRIRAWKEIKAEKAEEAADDEAFALEARAAAAEAIADEYFAPFDTPDQEPWDGC